MQPTIARQIILDEATSPAADSLESVPFGSTPIDLVLAESLGGDWPAQLRHVQGRLIDFDSSTVKIAAISATLAHNECEEAGRCLGALLRIVQRGGGRCLTLRFPSLYGHGAAEPFDGYQSAFNHAFHLMTQSRFDAEAAGVSVALEVASGGFLLSPVEARELIDSANSWSIGACVDLSTIGDDARALDWLHTLRGRVRCVRTFNPRSAGLNETLEAIGYEGAIIALK